MDFKGYLAILLRNKWKILATVIVTVAVVTVITFIIPPTYNASTTLRVATASSGVASYSDYMYADRLLNTFTKIATSSPVIQELKNKLELSEIPDINVAIVPNTELIKISVESNNPRVARDAANTLADILIDQGKQLYSGGGKSTVEILSEQLKQAEDELNQARQNYDTLVAQSPGDTESIAALDDAIRLKESTYASLLDQYDQARLRDSLRENTFTVVEPAILPTSPSKPNRFLNIGLGFAVGLAGGVGFVFFLENVGSSRLYSSKDIETVTNIHVIGKIPTMRRQSWPIFHKNGHDKRDLPFQEAFLRLQVQIFMHGHHRSKGKTLPFKKLLITSAEPGEGKSTIAANLAISMAESGKKVIVIDCDMHLPKQHKINQLPNGVGLSSILTNEATIDEAIQETKQRGMFVLTSGPHQANPTKLLETTELKNLLASLSQLFDIIILDTPAMLAKADTSLLIPNIDGVIMVARRSYVQEDEIKEACRQLTDIKAPMIGLVVNGAETSGSYYYYGDQ